MSLLCSGNCPSLTPLFSGVGNSLPPNHPCAAPPNNGMASDYPPFDRMASSSSHRTLRTTAQDSSHRAVTLPPEDPYDMPQATVQDPASEQHGSQSGGIVRRRPSRKTTALPVPPPPMPIDSQPSDLNEPQPSQVHTQADGHLGGAGQSRSNLRSTPGDRSASRRGVRGGKDSRGSPVRGDDRGRSRPAARPNDPIPSRMLLVLILAYLYLTQLAARFSM